MNISKDRERQYLLSNRRTRYGIVETRCFIDPATKDLAVKWWVKEEDRKWEEMEMPNGTIPRDGIVRLIHFLREYDV